MITLDLFEYVGVVIISAEFDVDGSGVLAMQGEIFRFSH